MFLFLLRSRFSKWTQVLNPICLGYLGFLLKSRLSHDDRDFFHAQELHTCMNIKVIFKETLAGVNFVYSAGKTYDLDSTKALKWIEAGICKKAEAKRQPETALAPPKMERAEATPRPKPKTRSKSED